MFMLLDHLFRLLDHFCFDSATGPGSVGRLSQTTEESMRQDWSWLSFTGMPRRINNFEETCTKYCLAETTSTPHPPPPHTHSQDSGYYVYTSLSPLRIFLLPSIQGPYTERIDLWFEPFFVKEIRRVIEWLQEIKKADQWPMRNNIVIYFF